MPRAAPQGAAAAVQSGGEAPALPGFRIAAPEAQRMLQERGWSMDTLLISLLGPVAELARPHISKYHVG